jgi:hypothetical protein
VKVHVNLCTHARPLGLIGTVMALQRLRSNQHEVRFNIGIDEDDQVSLDAASNLSAECPIDVSVGPRPIARGEIENRMLKLSADADVVTMLTDRTFCITPGWDDALAKGVVEQPKRLLWWTCPDDNGCVMPIIPRAWREAAENCWSPEIFPFWFDDTWNQQIDLMLYGLPSKKIVANYSGHRAKTKRARDFAFWIQLFNHLLPHRVEQAKTMAIALGVPFEMRPPVMEYIQRHYQTLMERIDVLEKHFGDNGDPGPEYAESKARAERLFAQLIVPAAEAAE